MGEIQLEPGEKIFKAVRKHWFVLLLNLLPFVVLAWLPTIILPFFSFVLNATPNSAQLNIPLVISSPYVKVLYGLWLLVLWSAVFNVLTLYYLNEWIITSTRIIQVQQYGYFSREVASLLLIKVQDVNVSVDGIFGTLLGYGQLEVQSAGATEHFLMDDIPIPENLRDIIMREIADLHVSDRAPVSGNVTGSL